MLNCIWVDTMLNILSVTDWQTGSFRDMKDPVITGLSNMVFYTDVLFWLFKSRFETICLVHTL